MALTVPAFFSRTAATASTGDGSGALARLALFFRVAPRLELNAKKLKAAFGSL